MSSLLALLKKNIVAVVIALAVIAAIILQLVQWTGNQRLSKQLLQARDTCAVLRIRWNDAVRVRDSVMSAHSSYVAVTDYKVGEKDKQIRRLAESIVALQKENKKLRDSLGLSTGDTSYVGTIEIIDGGSPIVLHDTTTIYLPRSWWGCLKKVLTLGICK